MISFKNRRLEVDILTIFILLISISSAVIITFSYFKNRNSILRFSKTTIDRVNSLILNRVDCMLGNLEIIPQIFTLTFATNPEISEKNTVLSSLFLDIVKLHTHLDAFFVGLPDNSFMGVWNLNFLDKSKLSFSVPPGTSFALLIIDQKNPQPIEQWIFYNQDLKKIGFKIDPTISFFPNQRPWFIGAEKEKKIYWSDYFTSFLTNIPIISVSAPVYLNSNELLGVLGANLNLAGLSDFIIQQKISEHGRAFILNDQGEVVAPTQKLDPLDQALIRLAKKTNEQNQVINYQGFNYLLSQRNFPLSISRNWQIFVIAPLLDFFAESIRTQNQVIMISIVILFFSIILVMFFSRRISKPIVILTDEIIKIKQLDLGSQVRVRSNIREIRLLDSSIASMRSALHSFSCYVPKEIVKILMQKEEEITLGGEKKQVTLFFSDITGMTSISEKLSLEKLNELLAVYYDGMSKLVLKNSGTIDKYIGDSLMAIWNAPNDVPDHAAKACIAALQCQEFVREFNDRQRAKNEPELFTRIGINTGTVFVGNIGMRERMNYTVIGDAVNTAQRLEQINKVYHTKILIGKEVIHQVGDQFLFRPIDITEIRGKKEKIEIFELIALKQSAKPEEIGLVESFITAYKSYHQGNLSEAKQLFADIHKKFPNDPITQIYLDRIK